MREVAAFICDDKRTRARFFGGTPSPPPPLNLFILNTKPLYSMIGAGSAADAVALLLPTLTCSVGQVLWLEL